VTVTVGLGLGFAVDGEAGLEGGGVTEADADEGAGVNGGRGVDEGAGVDGAARVGEAVGAVVAAVASGPELRPSMKIPAANATSASAPTAPTRPHTNGLRVPPCGPEGPCIPMLEA